MEEGVVSVLEKGGELNYFSKSSKLSKIPVTPVTQFPQPYNLSIIDRGRRSSRNPCRSRFPREIRKSLADIRSRFTIGISS